MRIRTKRVIFYSLTALLTLMASLSVLVAWSLNSDGVKHRIAAYIHQKTDQQVHIDDFSVDLFPHPSVQFRQIRYKPPFLPVPLSIDQVSVHFNTAKLFQGVWIVDRLIVEHPKMPPFSPEKKKGPTSFSPVDALSLLDVKRICSLLPAEQDTLAIHFKNAAGPFFDEMNGSVLVSRKDSKIILNTRIKKINATASDLFRTSPSPLNFESLELDSASASFQLTAGPKFNGTFQLSGVRLTDDKNRLLFDAPALGLAAALDKGRYQVDIPFFPIKYPDARFSLGFTYHPVDDGAVIRFNGSNVHIDQVRDAASKLIPENEVSTRLFDIVRGGTSPEVNVAFHSPTLAGLFDENHLVLNGRLQDGVVNIPETRLTATGVDGTARVENGKLFIQTANGFIHGSKIEKGTLDIDLLNYTDHPFEGTFNLDVDLSHVPKTLRTLLPGTLLARELARVSGVTGRSKAVLKLAMETGSDDLAVRVKAENFMTTGFYDRIPGKITLENISFEYIPDKVILEHATGRVNGSSISNLHTEIDFKDTPRIHIISGSGRIELDRTIPWLQSHERSQKMIGPIKAGSGILTIDQISLSGPVLEPELWQYGIKGDADAVSFTTHTGQDEISQLGCRYAIHHDLCKLSRVRLKAHNFSWLPDTSNTGHLNQVALPFILENGGLALSKNHASLTGTLKFPGHINIRAAFDLAGRQINDLAVNHISIIDKGKSDASISRMPPHTKNSLRFKGRLNTLTLDKILNPSASWSAALRKLTHGSPMVVETDTQSRIFVKTDLLDLQAVMSLFENHGSDRKTRAERTVHLQANQIKYKKWTAQSLDSIVRLSDQGMNIRLHHVSLCDLTTRGDIHINADPNQVHINLPFKAQNKENIQELMACLLGKENFMDGGRYTLECNLSSKSKFDAIKKSFNGDLQFSAEQGRIYKLTLLSRILSVLNVSNVFKGKIPDITQQGFAYKAITVQAEIKNSIIFLNRAVIDGEDMTMIFSGSIDPLADKLDITCLVAPFKTVDMIIEKIPIISTLLSGRLVSVPVKATGKLSDPVVIPLHPSAVGKGLVNIMTDILQTPIKLFDKLIHDSKHPEPDK